MFYIWSKDELRESFWNGHFDNSVSEQEEMHLLVDHSKGTSWMALVLSPVWILILYSKGGISK